METDAQMALDEALARHLQEMEHSHDDSETEGSKLVYKEPLWSSIFMVLTIPIWSFHVLVKLMVLQVVWRVVLVGTGKLPVIYHSQYQ